MCAFVRLVSLLRSIAIASLVFAATWLATNTINAVTIDWVTVGDPGNTSDPATGNGAVDYSYQIGKYKVTIGQYAEFLNTVDPEGANTYGLFHIGMETNLNVAGISFDAGRTAGSKYAVMDNGGDSTNRPITHVNWFDAARFANWMQNGQGSGDTETGAYDLYGATSGLAPGRNPGAQFYIPTQDEWYKAAYFSPVKGGVGSPGYYYYATQSDTDPGNAIGSNSNQANFYDYDYTVTQSADYDSNQNYLTDVGAFTNSASYYGTFDQSGGVYEWNDLNGAASYDRQIRGGSWANYVFSMASDSRVTYAVWAENDLVGFRMATVSSGPGPSPVPEIDPAGAGNVMALVAGVLGLRGVRRRQQRV